MEIAEIMDRIKIGRENTLPPELAIMSQDFAGLCDGWLIDPAVANWTSFAQNASLSAYTYILEDGLELPKESGPHADIGGEVLEGMDAEGCSSLRNSRIHQGMAGYPCAVSGTSRNPSAVSGWRERNNNNTFAWSGPSGVLAAPDSGP
jgi:hypothetical protein